MGTVGTLVSPDRVEAGTRDFVVVQDFPGIQDSVVQRHRHRVIAGIQENLGTRGFLELEEADIRGIRVLAGTQDSAQLLPALLATPVIADIHP